MIGKPIFGVLFCSWFRNRVSLLGGWWKIWFVCMLNFRKKLNWRCWFRKMFGIFNEMVFEFGGIWNGLFCGLYGRLSIWIMVL